MRTVLALGIALLVSAAYAATINPQIGGGIGQFDGGVSLLEAAVTPPPSGCSGAINTGDGCPLPMLGI